MRKFRYLILCSCLFLLSGCSAEYNLTINETTMVESINAIFNKETEYDYANRMENIRRSAYYNYDTRSDEYYSFKKKEDSKNIILNYSYIYSDNNLYKSEAFSRCYYKRVVNVTDKLITIDTDNQVACLYKDGEKEIDDLTINIYTELNVLDNNADVVKNNTYTWYINDENYNNKPIYIKIRKEVYKEPLVSQVFFIAFIIIIILIVSIFLYSILKKRMIKNNKIN